MDEKYVLWCVNGVGLYLCVTWASKSVVCVDICIYPCVRIRVGVHVCSRVFVCVYVCVCA